MKLRVINPNTSQPMTEKMGLAAEAVAAPGTGIVACCPGSGPQSVEGHFDEAIATVGLLEEVRRGEEEDCDGYLVACFGDPGLLAAREVARGPVIGIAEAAMHLASMIATGFTIVTTLERTCVIARELVERYGMQRACRGSRASDVPVLALEETGSDARVRIADECRRARDEDGAGAIVLGCAGMTDLADELSGELGIPVVEGVAAGIKLLESLVSLKLATCKRGDLAYPLPKTFTGEFAHLSS